MATRLVPLSGVFGRFARLVRDAAQSSGKQVRLETAGGDTRLDKAIVDRLGEPLVHLITNAVVHGVEREDVRRSRGKTAEAVIRLQRRHGERWRHPHGVGRRWRPRCRSHRGTRPRARARGELDGSRRDLSAHLRARPQHRRRGVLPGRTGCRPRRGGELAPCDGRVHHGGERPGTRHPVHPARAGDPRGGANAPLRGVRRALCHSARARRRDGAGGGWRHPRDQSPRRRTVAGRAPAGGGRRDAGRRGHGRRRARHASTRSWSTRARAVAACWSTGCMATGVSSPRASTRHSATPGSCRAPPSWATAASPAFSTRSDWSIRRPATPPPS